MSKPLWRASDYSSVLPLEIGFAAEHFDEPARRTLFASDGRFKKGNNTVIRHLALASAALVMGLPGLAQAVVWGQRTTILGYYSDTNADIVLTTANNQNPDGCTSSQYLRISFSASNFNQVYAALITAQATGSTVTLLYNGCLLGYPLISSVAVPANW